MTDHDFNGNESVIPSDIEYTLSRIGTIADSVDSSMTVGEIVRRAYLCGVGDTLTDRDHAAWRILSPIQQNAPAPVEGHIYGLLGMLDHVEYLGRTGETGRMHAERALRFDPSDRFASAVLDTAPAADGSTGLAELADIAQDRGTIR